MAGTIPTVSITDLADIYTPDALSAEQTRWTAFLSSFENTYSRSAQFVIRCPGRVNLIGEHIDYSLYDVLPMAVQQDVLLAVALRPHDDTSQSSGNGPRIRLASTIEKFPPKEFSLHKDGRTEIDKSVSDWSNYFKAGLCGAADLLRTWGAEQLHASLDVLVTGSVPPAAGMSSSSAFVCASVLAILTAAGHRESDKLQLVETALEAERLAGVNSGGMDQAASICSQRGSATAVSFVPKLAIRPVKFPAASSRPLNFLVAQSLVVADKYATAPEQYNLRVVECSLAAAVLARITGVGRHLKPDQTSLGISLRTFADAFLEQRGDVDNSDTGPPGDDTSRLEKMLKLVEDYLPQDEGYTREQISEILGTTVADLEAKYMSTYPIRATSFKLRQRALHVFGEALRVKAFLGLLENAVVESEDDSRSLIKDLGTLMNTTQDSCRELYECSCPELDELCAIAQAAGAVGSRLTGAGWGGCSVHLVPEDRVEKVKQAWIDKYYRKRYPGMTEEKLQEVIVASRPGSGSFVVRIEPDKLK